MGQTIFSLTFPAGLVVGLVGGAVIIQHFGWQATFLAILPVATGWVNLRFVRLNNDRNGNALSNVQTIDIKGTLALAATIIAFLVGITLLQNINNVGTRYQVGGIFAASGLALATFIIIEKRVPSPLLDLKLIRSKSFLPPTIILMLVFMSIFMVYMTVPVLVRVWW